MQKKYSISFTSNNTETHNNPFFMDELTNAMSKSHDTAVGPDSIHYQMLKNLPDSAVDTLLDAVNYIWTTGDFPPEWHLATVIPVAKPGKDSTDPTSYRPIALTSCLCKVMKRMINTRLVWYLKQLKLITPVQSGFRKQRSTTDQLVRLFVRHLSINSTLLQYFLILRKPTILLGNMVSWKTYLLPTHIHWKLSQRPAVPSTTWKTFVYSVWSGNGCASGEHFVSYPVCIKDQLNCEGYMP